MNAARIIAITAACASAGGVIGYAQEHLEPEGSDPSARARARPNLPLGEVCAFLYDALDRRGIVVGAPWWAWIDSRVPIAFWLMLDDAYFPCVPRKGRRGGSREFALVTCITESGSEPPSEDRRDVRAVWRERRGASPRVWRDAELRSHLRYH